MRELRKERKGPRAGDYLMGVLRPGSDDSADIVNPNRPDWQ